MYSTFNRNLALNLCLNYILFSEVGPKPVTEEHKEKMRAYMKKYRAIKAGKLPDIINHR